ncbi:MAG: hypothetical protein ACOCX8_00030 [Bacteroidota bacterium]
MKKALLFSQVLLLMLFLPVLDVHAQTAEKAPLQGQLSGNRLTPEIVVEPDSFYLVIKPDTVLKRQIVISNTGSDTLDFSMITNPPRKLHEGVRSIEGSQLTTNVAGYIPGETNDYTFSLYNGSPDNEWLDTLIIHLPQGVRLNFSTNFVGGTLGPLVYDGTSGNGVTVHYNDENGPPGGNILPGETATALLNLAFDESLDDTLRIVYEISGDVNNTPPHHITDTLILEPENVWLIAQPDSGNIAPGEQKTVDLFFNSGGFPIGNYLRHFIVQSNDTATPEFEVPVNMVVFPYNLAQTIDIPEGWSGISTYVHPFKEEVAEIFDTVSDRITVLRNQSGLFWPEQQINTLGNWDAFQGYVIHASEPIQVKVNGIFEVSQTVVLTEGWNILPVLTTQPASTFVVFRDLDEVIDIVQEVGSDKVYWPSQGIYTLTQLKPGKAYLIRVTETCSVVFPAPVAK